MNNTRLECNNVKDFKKQKPIKPVLENRSTR